MACQAVMGSDWRVLSILAGRHLYVTGVHGVGGALPFQQQGANGDLKLRSAWLDG